MSSLGVLIILKQIIAIHVLNFSFARTATKKGKWIETQFGIYICFFQRVSIKSILLMHFQLKNESLACISLIEDLLIPNCCKNYWAFGLSGLRTIGPSDYWAFGLLGIKTIESSDYRAFRLSGLRTIGFSDCRTGTVGVLSSFCVCNHVTIFSDLEDIIFINFSALT